jgi:hypothetical protein
MTEYKAPAPTYVGPPDKHSGDSNKPIVRIVLHGTVSAPVKGGARVIAAYFRSNSARGSAHYIIDPGEVLQVCYDSYVAWHSPPNPHSIGVEFCDWVGGPNGQPLPSDRWRDDNHVPMLRMGARLVAELCLHYGVRVRLVGPTKLKSGRGGICEHSDVSEAWHQSSHWDLGEFPRRRFLQMVKREVRAIQGGSPTGRPITPHSVAPNPKVKPTLGDRLEGRHRARRQDRSTEPAMFHKTEEEGVA